MAGTASLAAAPGGAADATAPFAGSVPPPLGAPQPGGGPDGASPVPSKGRETEPAEANEPHTRHACAVDARPLHTRPTPLSHPPERSHAPTCTRPNHTHMIVICRRTHPSHHHTPTRTCPGVNGHVDTHGGRLSSSARGIRQPSLSSAAPRPYAPCSGWPPLEEV